MQTQCTLPCPFLTLTTWTGMLLRVCWIGSSSLLLSCVIDPLLLSPKQTLSEELSWPTLRCRATAQPSLAWWVEEDWLMGLLKNQHKIRLNRKKSAFFSFLSHIPPIRESNPCLRLRTLPVLRDPTFYLLYLSPSPASNWQHSYFAFLISDHRGRVRGKPTS